MEVDTFGSVILYVYGRRDARIRVDWRPLFEYADAIDVTEAKESQQYFLDSSETSQTGYEPKAGTQRGPKEQRFFDGRIVGWHGFRPAFILPSVMLMTAVPQTWFFLYKSGYQIIDRLFS
ncbi:unnamed protein product [Cylicocyclus nassatus]|uniref:Uncharacterized protein n=1 Tax=Cylicocyclus nassatus TaxID=53992 RepID=A0AA36MF53_CYLNA|nr:unnamed protein product [Cylicocyclus nassatus]